MTATTVAALVSVAYLVPAAASLPACIRAMREVWAKVPEASLGLIVALVIAQALMWPRYVSKVAFAEAAYRWWNVRRQLRWWSRALVSRVAGRITKRIWEGTFRAIVDKANILLCEDERPMASALQTRVARVWLRRTRGGMLTYLRTASVAVAWARHRNADTIFDSAVTLLRGAPLDPGERAWGCDRCHETQVGEVTRDHVCACGQAAASGRDAEAVEQ